MSIANFTTPCNFDCCKNLAILDPILPGPLLFILIKVFGLDNLQILSNAFQKFIAALPAAPTELENEIIGQIEKLSREVANVGEKTFYAIIIIIFLLLIYNVIINMITGYAANTTLTLVMGIISILLIIIVGVLLYWYIRNQYINVSDNITLIINSINTYIDDIKAAATSGLCCISGVNCGPGTPCANKIATISASPPTATTGTNITFKLNINPPAYENLLITIKSVLWHFGDGITSTTGSHMYTTAGTYTVTVTLTIDGDCTDKNYSIDPISIVIT